jgi:hypothetical protein
MDLPASDHRVSRRRMIKRIAAAGLTAWSTPVIMGIAAIEGLTAKSAVAQPGPKTKVDAACPSITPLPAPGPGSATRCYSVLNRGGSKSCSPGIVCDYGPGPDRFDGSGPIGKGKARDYCCPAVNRFRRPIVAMTIECPRSERGAECSFTYWTPEFPDCFEAGGKCGPLAGCTNSGGRDLGRKDCDGKFATCCERKE